MLIQFSFSNYKSFKDESVLDLSAAKITENASSVFSYGNEKILPAAAVLGANASGKSNVIEAFRFMATYVLLSFGYGGDGGDISLKPEYNPFRFDKDSLDKDSVFEVYFTIDADEREKVYDYGFSLRNETITEEWLNVKSKTARKYKRVFYRDENELDLSGLRSRRSQENIMAALEKETLVVSLGAKLRIDVLKLVRDWFSGIRFADFGDPLENVMLSSLIPRGFSDDEAVQKQVLSYLSAFDKSILGFSVKKSPHQNEDTSDERRVSIQTLHRMSDGSVTTLPLREESAGTIKMFSLFSSFHDVLERGNVLVVDELNSRLHPLLVRNFLLSFLNPEINRHHAQIIFTTHDTWMLANNLLRRDEIWFTDKSEGGVSALYSLVDFTDESGMKIRKDENYERNYLLGKYGAIPTLEAFDMLDEVKNGKER